jgi:hypothetical protein
MGEWFMENRSSQSELGMRKKKLGHGWSSGNMGPEKAIISPGKQALKNNYQ